MKATALVEMYSHKSPMMSELVLTFLQTRKQRFGLLKELD